MTATAMNFQHCAICADTSADICAAYTTLVPDVPGFSRLAHVRTRTTSPTTDKQIFALVHLYTRHIRHIRHIVVFYRKKGKRGGTVEGTDHKTPAQAQNTVTRTIRTTLENAAQVQKLVKNSPQLLAMVQSLQSQGLFPGLRGFTFTLTGTPEHCASGLDGVAAALADAKQKDAAC